MKKYKKQLESEWKSLTSQLKRLTNVSIVLTLVLTGAAVASACGAGGGFV